MPAGCLWWVLFHAPRPLAPDSAKAFHQAMISVPAESASANVFAVTVPAISTRRPEARLRPARAVLDGARVATNAVDPRDVDAPPKESASGSRRMESYNRLGGPPRDRRLHGRAPQLFPIHWCSQSRSRACSPLMGPIWRPCAAWHRRRCDTAKV